MPQVVKYNSDGKQIGDMELSNRVFDEIINKSVVHQVVTAQLSKMRHGMASTKTRSEVRGGGRKPWRQKGTGRARHGSIRSPLWVGGGIVFGPKPRDYSKKISRKAKKVALRSILSDKVKAGNLLVIEDINIEKPNTREMVELLKNLKLEGAKVVIILPDKDTNVYLSARNIPDVKTLVVEALNAYDLLDNDYVVVMQEAIEKIEEVLVG